MQKFISKLSDTEKKIFFITVFLVLLAMFDRLFFGPMMSRLKDTKGDIEAEKASISQDLRFLGYKDRILSESNLYKEYFVTNINDDNVLNAEFLRNIERVAAQSNINLAKSNPLEPKKFKYHMEFYASLDCAGTLMDVIKFIYNINSAPSLLKVRSFSITPKRGTDSVSLSMTVMQMVTNPDMVNKIEETAATK